MRLLCSHGLTFSDLYVNTPSRVTTRTRGFFRKAYNMKRPDEDYLSDPLRYCFGLILEDMIDNRIRFVLPVKTVAYLDFSVSMGSVFEKRRQLGRFQDVDFISSGFMGYDIKYYFKGKAYMKEWPVYLGGELRRRFINNINSGIRYYSVQERTVDDYLDVVQEKFNFLTKIEIKKLLVFGFIRMQSAMSMGCALNFISINNVNYLAHVGVLYWNQSRQYNDYNIKHDKKLRKLYKWLRTPFNGYYYIGINNARMPEFVEENKKARNTLIFRNVILRKIEAELYYKAKDIYIFRYPVKEFRGFSFWKEKIKSNKIEYVGKAHHNAFIPAEITWKQLIKEYEQSSE